MRYLVLTAVLVIPTSTSAQPYSASMADCAALYQNAAQWMPEELVDPLMYAAVQWHGEAVAQSVKEGRPLSDRQMWDKVDAQTEVWERQGRGFLISQEFNDWSDYCRSFAKQVDVSYIMPTD